MTGDSMTSEAVRDAGRVFIDPAAYADEDRFQAATALLRREDPVHWVDGDGEFNPFWAITKHADVFEIETKHALFLNEPRPVLATALDDQRRHENGDLLRTLISRLHAPGPASRPTPARRARTTTRT